MRHERRTFMEWVLTDPSRAASLFFLGGAAAGIAAVPGWDGSPDSFPILVALIVSALVIAAGLWVLRDRLTLFRHQLLMIVAVIIISVANAIEQRSHANVGVLYVWATVYAAIYFPRKALIFQNVFTSISYFVVLLIVHEQRNWFFSSWIFITGTCALLSVIIYGLVNIFRRINREDPLTRLANRRAWDERLEEEIERARRGSTPLSLIAIDINDFKRINDRSGHQEGDRILQSFASEWTNALRGSGDFVARLGGDEFAILVPGTGETGLRAVVQRIGAIAPKGVTSSLGTVTWDGVESASALMHRADQAMYENKRR